MQWAKQTKSGFTIVELLIVVVVIAILATISVVAYNGITERARTSSAASYASQLKKRDLIEAQGFFDFNECSGTAANNTGDKATSATGSFVGSPTYSTDTPSGSGCSISLNGSSAITTDITLSNEYYMKSAWIKSSSGAGSQNIISSTTGSSNNAAFYLNNGRVSGGHNGAWNTVISTQPFNDGKWHHVALEFKRNDSGTNGTLRLYIDGTLASTASSAALMNDTNQAQSIGQFGASSRFNGLLDDVLIVVK